MLSFDECFKILDYWFQIDKNVTLVDPNEKQIESAPANEASVNQVLLDTVEQYKKMQEKSVNEMEKKVLQNTINMLESQLKQLESGTVENSEQKGLSTPAKKLNQKSKIKDEPTPEKKLRRNVKTLKHIPKMPLESFKDDFNAKIEGTQSHTIIERIFRC